MGKSHTEWSEVHRSPYHLHFSHSRASLPNFLTQGARRPHTDTYKRKHNVVNKLILLDLKHVTPSGAMNEMR